MTHWLFGRDVAAPKPAKFRENFRQRLKQNT